MSLICFPHRVFLEDTPGHPKSLFQGTLDRFQIFFLVLNCFRIISIMRAFQSVLSGVSRRLIVTQNVKETRTENEMIEGVRSRMLDAIRLRLRADVRVGVYLSGGIDSSAIAGMMTHLVRERGEQIGNDKETERISCFSIAFDEDSGFDESGM